MSVHGRWPLTTGVAQGRYYCNRNTINTKRMPKINRESSFTLEANNNRDYMQSSLPKQPGHEQYKREQVDSVRAAFTGQY